MEAIKYQVSLRKSRIEMLEIAEQERNALEQDKQDSLAREKLELMLGGTQTLFDAASRSRYDSMSWLF